MAGVLISSLSYFFFAKNTNIKSTIPGAIGLVGAALGKGLIAGFAGTIAITLSQTIEMKITGRKPSDTPAKAVKKTLHIEAEPGKKEELSTELHWVYCAAWGAFRGLPGLTGIDNIAAAAAHIAAVWGTAIAIEPALNIAPQITEWESKDIAVDVFHHIVYAAVNRFGLRSDRCLT